MWNKIFQCLGSDSATVLWALGGGVVSIAVAAGGFVSWIMSTRIELLKDQIEKLKVIAEGHTGAAKSEATFWENQYRECEKRLSRSAGYSWKHLVAASVMAAGVGGGLTFLYEGGSLQAVRNENTTVANENEKNKTLLRPLTSTFGEETLRTASQRSPQSVSTLDSMLTPPVLIVSGSGATYRVGTQLKKAQRLQVTIKPERASNTATPKPSVEDNKDKAPD